MVGVYVRVRGENGTYKKVEVGPDELSYPGLTRYFDCKKCGKRVVAVEALRDSRGGYCFDHIPRDIRLLAEPRMNITLY